MRETLCDKKSEERIKTEPSVDLHKYLDPHEKEKNIEVRSRRTDNVTERAS